MRKKILTILTAMLLLGFPIVLAASSTYYGMTTVYFNVPSDATFSISFPDDYTSWNAITGETEGGATDLSSSDWVSFNFSAVPDTWAEPQHLGVAANIQAGITKPIFFIDNTGNVDEQFELYWATTLPAGIEVCGNSSCTGTCTSPGTISACTEIGVGEASESTFASTITNSEYLNITLYGNVTAGTAGGETSETIYIHSTAV